MKDERETVRPVGDGDHALGPEAAGARILPEGGESAGLLGRLRKFRAGETRSRLR
ncbi:MAG TPA: hypothetical protein VN256_01060 [Pyrinomonadaceae bacterium]|nr:hypothetical protein [Pyrinomonadaceae bacterium]